MKLVASTLACNPLLPFANTRLQAFSGARAQRRAAVFRSCPPGRLKNQAPRLAAIRPSSLISLHPAPHHSARTDTLAFQGLGKRQRFLRRMPGDRRREVKEEGRMASARSDWAVNRAGGHERSRSPGSLRARRPMQAANSFRTATKECKQRVARALSIYASRVALSMEEN